MARRCLFVEPTLRTPLSLSKSAPPDGPCVGPKLRRDITAQDPQNAAKERPARFSTLSIARSDALKAMKFHDNGHVKLGAIGQQY